MAEKRVVKIRDKKLCVLQKPVWITELKASLMGYIGRWLKKDLYTYLITISHP